MCIEEWKTKYDSSVWLEFVLRSPENSIYVDEKESNEDVWYYISVIYHFLVRKVLRKLNMNKRCEH